MKTKKPTQPTEPETTTIATGRLKALEHTNHQFGQIAANVWQFGEDDTDTIVDCVLRLLEKYHSAKAEVYELQRILK